VEGLGSENGRRLSRIQPKFEQGRGILHDTEPRGLSECVDACCRGTSVHSFVPDGPGHNDIAKQVGKDVKNTDLRQVDERRAVGNDQHATCLVPVDGNGSELPPEVLDVVVDGEQAVAAGFDQKVVE